LTSTVEGSVSLKLGENNSASDAELENELRLILSQLLGLPEDAITVVIQEDDSGDLEVTYMAEMMVRNSSCMHCSFVYLV
jgi:hypothetical protein